MLNKYPEESEISTHTLTWSVTSFGFSPSQLLNDFNSHAHVERDLPLSFNFFILYISTHTLTWSVTLWEEENINEKEISTHTLTWSVTNLAFQFILLIQISTHTLTWSVTICGEQNAQTHNISTHTLTWSVTLDVVYIWCLLNVMRTYCFI